MSRLLAAWPLPTVSTILLFHSLFVGTVEYSAKVFKCLFVLEPTAVIGAQGCFSFGVKTIIEWQGSEQVFAAAVSVVASYNYAESVAVKALF